MNSSIINKKFKEQPKDIRPQRGIIIGDIHAGIHCNSNEWFNNIVSFFINWFIPWLLKNYRKGDVIFQTGDLNDNNQVVRTEITDAMLAIFEKIAEIIPVVFIIGNHDIVRKFTNHVNSIRPLGKDPNMFVYPETAIWETAYGEKIRLMPWNHSPAGDRKIIEAATEEYLISHTHYNGLFFNDEFIYKEKGEPVSINIPELKKFKRVVNGHIHKMQVIDNLLNVGTPYHTKSEDAGNKCGIHVLDFETNEFEFIENHFSPKYHILDIWDVLEMEVEDFQKIVENNYVKVKHSLSLAKLLNMNDIRKTVSGYKELEFVSYVENKRGEFIKNSKEMVEGQEVPVGVDISAKIPSFIDNMPIEEAQKDKLKEYLGTLYTKAHKKVKEFEEIEIE